MEQFLKVKVLNPDTPNATIPTRGSAGSIGLDLYSNMATRIYSGCRRLVSTGIAVAIPTGYYGRVAPRSGLALKHGIDILAGVVDSDYRGELFVLMHNTDTNGPYYVQPGDRIAQLILERADVLPIQIVTDLEESVRGEAGFGSTGK